MFEAVQFLMWKHAAETGGEVPTTSRGCVSVLQYWFLVFGRVWLFGSTDRQSSPVGCPCSTTLCVQKECCWRRANPRSQLRTMGLYKIREVRGIVRKCFFSVLLVVVFFQLAWHNLDQ